MNNQVLSIINKGQIRNSEGVWFDIMWDEANNSMHLIENSKLNSMRMYDFEQTRGVNVTK